MRLLRTGWLYTKRVAQVSLEALKKDRSVQGLLQRHFNYHGKVDVDIPLEIKGKRLRAVLSKGRLYLIEKKLWHAYTQIIDCRDITTLESRKRFFGGEITLKFDRKMVTFHQTNYHLLKELERHIWQVLAETRPVDVMIHRMKNNEQKRYVSQRVSAPLHRHGRFTAV